MQSTEAPCKTFAPEEHMHFFSPVAINNLKLKNTFARNNTGICSTFPLPVKSATSLLSQCTTKQNCVQNSAFKLTDFAFVNVLNLNLGHDCHFKQTFRCFSNKKCNQIICLDQLPLGDKLIFVADCIS